MAYDLNELRKKYEEEKLKQKNKENNTGNSNYLKLEKGSNVLRILPSKKEGAPFFTHTKLHVVKDSANNLRYYHCLKVHGESCPLCDAYFEMWKRHKAGDKEVAERYGKGQGSIKPKARYYMNVVNRRDDSVKVLSAPDQIYLKIISNICGDTELNIEPLGDVTDVENGYDFNLIVGTKPNPQGGEFTDYSQSDFKRKPNPAGRNQLESQKYLDMRHDLEALVKKEDYQELKLVADTILSGGVVVEKEVWEEEKAPLSDDEFKATLKG